MLVKEQVINLVEVNALAVVQVQVATIITDNGVPMTPQYSRYCIAPGDDYSTESDLVKSICAAVHTEDTIAAYLVATKVAVMEIVGSSGVDLDQK